MPDSGLKLILFLLLPLVSHARVHACTSALLSAYFQVDFHIHVVVYTGMYMLSICSMFICTLLQLPTQNSRFINYTYMIYGITSVKNVTNAKTSAEKIISSTTYVPTSDEWHNNCLNHLGFHLAVVMLSPIVGINCAFKHYSRYI